VRRVRLTVVLLALAIAVPLALLVHRAVRSVALERAERHRAVAERVFDEMERALSEVLRVEEERPVTGFTAAAPTRLAVGYFEVGPDGEPVVVGRDPAVVERAARQETRRAGRKPGETKQLPGTTVGLAKRSREAPAALAMKDEREPSAYGALRALNKAVSERAERQQKTKPIADATAEADAVAGRRDLPRADLPAMTGGALGSAHLVLSRTVHGPAGVVRQGVVLDVDPLGDVLRARALGNAALAAHATTTIATYLGAVPAADYVYQHRFADPFADLSARLALRTLPGSGDARYVYALSIAVVLATLLGLLALHRTVAVAMAFAERRSNFVAAVSHELKTPLTAIRMYGEMLRDGIVASEAKRAEYYRHITAESERLSRLVNGVLELSRLEKGTRGVALETGSIEPVVREAAELARPHVEAEGVRLRLETAGPLPRVRFERDALVQVLLNLVDNAVKYGRDGGAPVIDVRVEGADGGVRLIVRDTGPGVAARHLPHVFEPFYRGEDELTRRHAGTGIGLALVRGLAERMGATVRARNVERGGFEVAVAFPAARS
jgi:signal transduction histidine kinase